MENLTKDDIKIAILKELAVANKELYKLNLLGNHPDPRGPLEHRLRVTFDKSQRALAARAFDEVKQEGLTQPQYGPGQVDAENWVEITDSGRRVLQTGVLDIRLQAADSFFASGVSKFGPPDHSSFQNSLSGRQECE